MRLRTINLANIVFGIVAALFLYFIIMDMTRFFARAAPDGNALSGARDAHDRPGPIEQFASVLERPLFLPSRHAPVIDQAQASPPKLVGTVSTGSEHYALLRVDGSSTLLVAVGQSIQGWRVVGVDGAKVRLIGPDGTATTVEARQDAVTPESGAR